MAYVKRAREGAARMRQGEKVEDGERSMTEAGDHGQSMMVKTLVSVFG